jgi:predicted transcriptional regulator
MVGRRQRVEATEGPRMQTTTIALDEETHLRLRRLALDEKTSFRELIREAIADLLKRRERHAAGRGR